MDVQPLRRQFRRSLFRRVAVPGGQNYLNSFFAQLAANLVSEAFPPARARHNCQSHLTPRNTDVETVGGNPEICGSRSSSAEIRVIAAHRPIELCSSFAFRARKSWRNQIDAN